MSTSKISVQEIKYFLPQHQSGHTPEIDLLQTQQSGWRRITSRHCAQTVEPLCLPMAYSAACIIHSCLECPLQPLDVKCSSLAMCIFLLTHIHAWLEFPLTSIICIYKVNYLRNVHTFKKIFEGYINNFWVLVRIKLTFLLKILYPKQLKYYPKNSLDKKLFPKSSKLLF